MRPLKKKLKNVIFSGGGFKGWAYIGSIRALKENIPFENINQIIGVSCGSIFSLFYLLQLDNYYLLEYFLNVDLKKYIDIDIDSVISNQSLLEGKKMKLLILDIIKDKITEETTFKELYNKTGILYTLGTFCIKDMKVEYLNKDTTPDISVLDGIMASCALPLLFPAYKINDKLYYDVGFCNNCPCNLVNIENTLAFDLTIDRSDHTNIYLFSLFFEMMNLLNKQYNNTNNENTFKLLDIRFKDQFINLSQTKDDIFNIYMCGYKNTKKILEEYYN